MRERAHIAAFKMLKKTVVEIVILTAIGAILAFIGPFGSFALPIELRLLYWIALVLIGLPLFRASRKLAGWLVETSHVPETVALLITIAIAAVPMTFIVALFFYWDFTLPEQIEWSGLGQLFMQVWLIAALVSGVASLAYNRRHQTEPHHMRIDPITPPRDDAFSSIHLSEAPSPNLPEALSPLFDLPVGFGPIFALNSEDHYVRVIGDGHSALILMRLRDAIALMPAEAGIQVHRSWWIATEAIDTVKRDGRSMSILLKGGTIVPVSRDNIGKVSAFERKGAM